MYTQLKDPVSVVFNWKFFLSLILSAGLYFLLFIFIPQLRISSEICASIGYGQQCLDLLDFSTVEHWQRGLFVFMLIIFLRMWYVYFKSSFQPHEIKETGVLEPDFNYEYAVQSLRRFLSLCAMQWQVGQTQPDKQTTASAVVAPCQDEGVPLNEAFRRKASMSVEVAALFMVIVTLTLDKSSDVIISYQAGDLSLDLWEIIMLSLSSVFGIFSFICFLISVDSLDTTFNKFISKSTRQVALQYFYQVTSNPRYSAVVCMMLSMVFFFSFFSSFLATLSLTVLMYVGYRLWFPNINQAIINSGFKINYDSEAENKDDIFVVKRQTISFSFFLLVLAFQLVYLIATFFL